LHEANVTYGVAQNCIYAHLQRVNHTHMQLANRRLV
jgi:hypothetical protein